MTNYTDHARRLGGEAADELMTITAASGRDIHRELEELGSPLSGSWEDGLASSDLYEDVTGLTYPEILTDEVGDVVVQLADAYEAGFRERIAGQ